MHLVLIKQLSSSLSALRHLLHKGQEHADKHHIEHATLLNAQLAPDMFPLTRQVQIAADNAKFAADRLADREAPSYPDDEQTFAQLDTRLANTIAFLDTFGEADFAEASSRKVPMQAVKGFYLSGDDYLVQFILPNFYFHVTTAYDILRHQGVQIGKRDLFHSMNLKPLEL
jgi:hypothetical protein